MLTLNTVAHIEEGTPFINVPLNIELPSGEYEVVIVLNMQPVTKKNRLTFANHAVNIPLNQTFRREEMYDDNDR